MRKSVISLLLCTFLILPSSIHAVADANAKDTKASILADYETGDIIYSHNLKEKIEVASITKVMTYVVAMDQVSKGKVKLDDKVTISEKAAQRGGSSFKLKAGQVYTLEKLLESCMIASANDSCIAVAEHISGSEAGFIKLMNEKAKELKLDTTNYVSVNGFPEEGVHNTMSAEDILKLATYAIDKYPDILKITSKQSLIDEQRGFEFTNTNPLLGKVEGISGLKTGYADKAGYCLISTKETKESKLISIVMGAESANVRKNKSLELLEGKLTQDFKKSKILDKKIATDSLVIPNSANGKIAVYPEGDLYGMIANKKDLSKTVKIYDQLKFPVKKGQPVGEVTIKYNDNIKTMNLVAQEDIKQKNFINTSLFTLKNFLAYAF